MGSQFDEKMNCLQIKWRKRQAGLTKKHGKQNRYERPWILPKNEWEEGLWPGIRSGQADSLSSYLAKSCIQKHSGVHNLKSSWMLCANLYFPHRSDTSLIATFLADQIDCRIEHVHCLELEWAEDNPLDPSSLLGEPGGKRGSGQTSPDVAFIVGLKGGGQGIVLTEVKFTESSFYSCSGRKKEAENPCSRRCFDVDSLIENPREQCHLFNWKRGRRTNRRYWDYISICGHGEKQLVRCPAAINGYQLFRQQALAEALAACGKYELVVNSVAYDSRNETLVGSLKNTGIQDFTKEWNCLFDGRAKFSTFTHQEWVEWVRHEDIDDRWDGWLQWVDDRYMLSCANKEG